MSDEHYLTLSSVQLGELRTAERGLLLTTRGAPLGEIIVSVTNGERVAIYPRINPPFSLYPADSEQADKTGVLFVEPSIEVDHGSMFDPEKGEQLGDLVIGSEGIALVAHRPGGFRPDDRERVALWPGAAPTKLELGFRRWRMVAIDADGERRVVFTHPPS